MKKKDLIKALELFNDDDELAIGEECYGYVPTIRAVCGKGQKFTALFCDREPDHDGACYCPNKRTRFYPDSK